MTRTGAGVTGQRCWHSYPPHRMIQDVSVIDVEKSSSGGNKGFAKREHRQSWWESTCCLTPLAMLGSWPVRPRLPVNIQIVWPTCHLHQSRVSTSSKPKNLGDEFLKELLLKQKFQSLKKSWQMEAIFDFSQPQQIHYFLLSIMCSQFKSSFSSMPRVPGSSL